MTANASTMRLALEAIAAIEPGAGEFAVYESLALAKAIAQIELDTHGGISMSDAMTNAGIPE